MTDLDALSESSPALRKLLAEANAAAHEVGRAIVSTWPGVRIPLGTSITTRTQGDP